MNDKIQILVVDDDPDITQFLDTALGSIGYGVTIAKLQDKLEAIRASLQNAAQ